MCFEKFQFFKFLLLCLEPKNALFVYNRGICYEAVNDSAGALRCYREATEVRQRDTGDYFFFEIFLKLYFLFSSSIQTNVLININ